MLGGKSVCVCVRGEDESAHMSAYYQVLMICFYAFHVVGCCEENINIFFLVEIKCKREKLLFIFSRKKKF